LRGNYFHILVSNLEVFGGVQVSPITSLQDAAGLRPFLTTPTMLVIGGKELYDKQRQRMFDLDLQVHKALLS
jgi:hypothetical protein